MLVAIWILEFDADAHCPNRALARSRPAEALRRHGAGGVVPNRRAGCARALSDAVRQWRLRHLGSSACGVAALATTGSRYARRDRAPHADDGGGALPR